jgi:exopolyphosphatase/pppGpp-phosphohydrolase
MFVIRAERVSYSQQTIFTSYWSKKGLGAKRFACKFLTKNEARKALDCLKRWQYINHQFKIEEVQDD